MDVRIIGKHVDITDAGRARIEEKISKLPKFYNNINDVEVIVEGNEGATSQQRGNYCQGEAQPCFCR